MNNYIREYDYLLVINRVTYGRYKSLEEAKLALLNDFNDTICTKVKFVKVPKDSELWSKRDD